MSDDTPDAPTGSPAKGASPASRHIYGREWLEICNMAREGVPVGKIAKSYGVAPSSIYRGLKKRGVMIGAYTKTADELEGDKDRKELVERIRKTRDEDYRYTDHLMKRVIKVQLDAEKTGQKPGTVEKDMKSLKMALEAIRIGTDNKWRILGLDKENTDADKALPELPIRVMSPEEVAAIRDRQSIEDSIDEDELDSDLDEADEDVIEGEGPEGGEAE